MIAKIKTRADFGGIVNYANDQKNKKKCAILLAHEGVCVISNKTIADSFQIQASMRPKVKSPVKHVSLAFSSYDISRFPDNEEGDTLMVEIAKKWMEQMGIRNTQYIITRHHDTKHLLAAAMKICDGFMMLHRCGYSYQDLNDGNFFIDPTNGDVLICDNDNVMPQGEKSGIMGKARYMAPEIVAGGIPDKRSDRFSLSVILFMLFYANHPFEGERVIACPCMTESYERKFYGSEAIFIYDPTNNTNRPVRGIHQNVIKRWFVFPSILRETFEREFSQDYLHNPEKRMIEQNWEKIISRVRDQLVICPICKEETFVETNGAVGKCINRGCNIDISKRLFINNRSLPLTDKTEIFIDNDNTPDAIVSKDANGVLIIRNISSDKWTVETPSGKVKTVESQGIMPVKEGLKIMFKIREIPYRGEITNI